VHDSKVQSKQASSKRLSKQGRASRASFQLTLLPSVPLQRVALKEPPPRHRLPPSLLHPSEDLSSLDF